MKERQNCLVVAGSLDPTDLDVTPHFCISTGGTGAGAATPQSLDLHIYKMALSTALTSQGCYKDLMR